MVKAGNTEARVKKALSWVNRLKILFLQVSVSNGQGRDEWHLLKVRLSLLLRGREIAEEAA